MIENNKRVSEKEFKKHLAKHTKVTQYHVLGDDPRTTKYFAELSKDTLKPVGIRRIQDSKPVFEIL